MNFRGLGERFFPRLQPLSKCGHLIGMKTRNCFVPSGTSESLSSFSFIHHPRGGRSSPGEGPAETLAFERGTQGSETTELCSLQPELPRWQVGTVGWPATKSWFCHLVAVDVTLSYLCPQENETSQGSCPRLVEVK